MRVLKLKSGNVFYRLPLTKASIPLAVVLKPIANNKYEFIGGYAGKEVIRKLRTFNALSGTSIVNIEPPRMKDVNFDNFLSSLGRYGTMFKPYLFVTLIDDKHGGMHSESTACDSRRYYYRAVGLDKFYKSKKGCPIWAMIANHVAIFGIEKFAETFALNNDASTSLAVNLSIFSRKHKYEIEKFYAPAYYLIKASRAIYKVPMERSVA